MTVKTYPEMNEKIKEILKLGLGGPEDQYILARIEELEAEVERYKQWVNDLQSGLYVNCVYCGHRYGPVDEVPTSMADMLKEHVENCPKHPMSALKAELKEMKNNTEEKNISGFIQRLEIKSGTGNGIGRATIDKIKAFAVEEGFLGKEGTE